MCGIDQYLLLFISACVLLAVKYSHRSEYVSHLVLVSCPQGKVFLAVICNEETGLEGQLAG